MTVWVPIEQKRAFLNAVWEWQKSQMAPGPKVGVQPAEGRQTADEAEFLGVPENAVAQVESRGIKVRKER